MPDPFQTLSLPPRFDLDQADLHAKFIHASSATHPDRYTDPVEQAQAAERAAEVNHAYAVLSDPERRADALLTLLGGPAKDEDKSLPPDLLMDMMQTRERMEQAIVDDDRAELDKLRGWAHDQRDAHLKRIADLFADTDAGGSGDSGDSGDSGGGGALPPDTAKAIRLELNALRYIQRMLDQMPG